MSDPPTIDEASPSPSEPFSVGYARPPQEHQFKKGASGNPRGRPRKAATMAKGPLGWGDVDFDQLVLDEAWRPVTVTENGKTTKTTTIEGLLKRLRVQALAGDRPSQLRLTHLFSSAQRRVQSAKVKLFKEAVEYRSAAIAKIVEAREEGRPEPPIFPHPLDMVLDPLAVAIKFNGPMTHEEHADWEEACQFRAKNEKEIEEIETSIETGVDLDASEVQRLAILRTLVRRASILYPDKETSDNFYGAINSSGSIYTVSVGSSSETFSLASGVYTTQQQTGSTLVTNQSGLYVYTMRDGSQATFDPSLAGGGGAQANVARIVSLTQPTGETLTYAYTNFCSAGTQALALSGQTVPAANGVVTALPYPLRDAPPQAS